MNDELRAIVLAAGKGTRLKQMDGDLPKVMREACGKPLLWHVLGALSFIEKKDITIVVGYMKEKIMDWFNGYNFAVQTSQQGTGHAVMSASPCFEGYDGSVLVCYGDMPVVRSETYGALLKTHFDQGNDCTILSGEASSQLPFGRIIRDDKGLFQKIVEERDCSPEQLMVTELNSGVYVFRANMLFDALKNLRNDNAQGEYYLTDVPEIMLENGAKIEADCRCSSEEIIGVNTLDELMMVEKTLKGYCSRLTVKAT